MVEKIKDILFDLTDFVLVLVIVVVMISVISLKVTDSLSLNPFSIIAKNSIEHEITIDKQNNNDIELDNLDIKPNISSTDSNIEKPEEILIEPDTTLDIKKTIPEVVELKITIKSGSTGYDIAKLLMSNNLIDNTQIFISRVEELKLGAKLRSGTFTLNSSLPLDEIIFIIAGKI